MTDNRSRWIVSTEWLAEHLEAPDVVVVDASWYLEITQRNGYQDYLREHIPGAVFFDLDEIADVKSPFPHTMPRPEVFASKMRKMGIGDGQKIVIYDGDGMMSAARVWWTFRLMGVDDVVILDGGLAKWEEEHRPIDDEPVRRPERHFTARFDHGGLRDITDVQKALGDARIQVVDTRPSGRFNGTEPEPRDGIPSGHMAGAISLPSTDLLVDGHRMKDADGIRQTLADAGVDPSKPIITTCGSGVTASILNLALEVIGHHNHALFDGSWAEWASSDMPIEDLGAVREAG